MGSTGLAVSALQQRLQQDGYVLEMLGYSDGTFDRATYNAVTAFQASHPGTAKADGKGIYGPATDAALRQEVQ
jgi:peptidoglycan hydrolase-like protein with peptidoglycan-binding domain